ncbi:MAG: helix-turn-helix transcriptional regulator [Candidatus Omnitrophica bacterium]|nr:helix-turn-helix transcriptional regulator [Candidatus Omnitrophota bacterium]MDD5080922.1 helix-turn-helix transcriptional regulator [Candidatus Omnitrophota bacterium]
MKKHVNIKKIRQEFGMVVRRERHKLNLSQEDFADIVNIHRTYVSSIELGKVDIGIGVAFKIANALNLPLSKIVKETESHLSD